MRLSAIALAASLAIAAPGLAAPAAQDTAAPAPPTTASAYLTTAASADQFEIQSSQHALQVSPSPDIKSAAQMIITDHIRLSAELKNVAASAGIAPPPPALVPRHRAMLDRLKATRAAGFDQAYRQAQLLAHREALNLHRTYAERGDNPALKAAAARAVPVIERHFEHFQGLKTDGKAGGK